MCLSVASTTALWCAASCTTFKVFAYIRDLKWHPVVSATASIGELGHMSMLTASCFVLGFRSKMLLGMMLHHLSNRIISTFFERQLLLYSADVYGHMRHRMSYLECHQAESTPGVHMISICHVGYNACALSLHHWAVSNNAHGFSTRVSHACTDKFSKDTWSVQGLRQPKTGSSGQHNKQTCSP